MLAFLKNNQSGIVVQEIKETPALKEKQVENTQPKQNINPGPGVEIIEMDRMRKLIADHMVNSKKVSPHVTSFVEADVTNIVNTWVSGTRVNDGMLIRRSDSEEGDIKNYGKMKFFSKDTNTVYAPRLDIMWDDSTHVPVTSEALNTSLIELNEFCSIMLS